MRVIGMDQSVPSDSQLGMTRPHLPSTTTDRSSERWADIGHPSACPSIGFGRTTFWMAATMLGELFTLNVPLQALGGRPEAHSKFRH